MKIRKLTYYILALFLIYISHVRYSLSAIDVKTDIDPLSGIQTTAFNTPYGEILIILPEDIEAGDSISGIIMVQGTKPGDENSLEKLYKYTIGINNNTFSVAQRSAIKFALPKSSTGGVTYMVLRNEQGDEVSRTYITYQNYVFNFNTAGTPSPWEFQTPSLGRSGRYSVVNGPFDGNFGTTSVTVGNSSVTKIAESPRKMIFENPVNDLGETELRIVERGIEVRRKYQNIQVVKLDGSGEIPPAVFDSPEKDTPGKIDNAEYTEHGDTQQPLASGKEIKGGYIEESKLDDIETGPFRSTDTTDNKNIPDIYSTHSKNNSQESFGNPAVMTSEEGTKDNQTTGTGLNYTIQVASYKKEKDATELLKRLESKGYDVKITKANIPQKGTWYRVRVGLFESKNLASNYGLKLKNQEPLVKSMFVTRAN